MTEVLDKETLKALSTDTRQEIIKMLSNRPYTASEIAKLTNKHVTTVTEHLNVLERSGLIHRKDSTNKWVYYELSDKGGRLFKPKIYSWIVMIGLCAVIFVFGLSQLFFSSFGSGSTLMTQNAIEEAKAVDAYASGTSSGLYGNEITTFVALLLMAVAIGLFVYFYRIRRVRQALI